MTDHLMIDLETLSTRSTAAIVSIGACWFNREGVLQEPPSPEHPVQFYMTVLPKTFTGHISGDTIAWWMKQSDAARYEAFNNNACRWDHDYVVTQFLRWIASRKIAQRDLRIWSHGATYDIPIIENAILNLGRELPWGHRSARDVRGVLAQAGVKIEDYASPDDPKHVAIGDARVQARAVIDAISRLPTEIADNMWNL